MVQWYNSLMELTQSDHRSSATRLPSDVPSFILPRDSGGVKSYIHEGDDDNRDHQDFIEAVGNTVSDTIIETILVVPLPSPNDITQFDSPLDVSSSFQSSGSTLKPTSPSDSSPRSLMPPPLLKDRPLLLSPRKQREMDSRGVITAQWNSSRGTIYC